MILILGTILLVLALVVFVASVLGDAQAKRIWKKSKTE